ncbi:unnamed protein product [Agarophyton chilense]|eukprot:gb/GEZJ01001778.1/.p1 GENE.gb/GEZJ01001778.1/~~gb/GEZJ01001778.1/.p1  ORF type:complete len:152 (-),score=34.63 gb/GEZJ01001778.1/:203-658(-)
MSLLNFVLPAPFTARAAPAPIVSSRSSFTPRVSTVLPACSARSRAAMIRMGADSEREDGYVIRESEYHDPDQNSDDDSGDGFMGEAEMDDILGVSMPDDLASFEKREIMEAESREELVEKLKEIKFRRRDIIVDRRRGLGMDNVGNYLNNL